MVLPAVDGFKNALLVSLAELCSDKLCQLHHCVAFHSIQHIILEAKKPMLLVFCPLIGTSMFLMTQNVFFFLNHFLQIYVIFFISFKVSNLGPKKNNFLFPVTRPSLIKTSKLSGSIFFYDFARPYFLSFIFARPIFFLYLAIAADPLSFDNMQLSNHRE